MYNIELYKQAHTSSHSHQHRVIHPDHLPPDAEVLTRRAHSLGDALLNPDPRFQ